MKKSVAVLGMGRFGQYLVQELVKNGADVLIADGDRKIVESFAGIVSDAVVAELTNPDSIRQIGLEGTDVVIVTMGSSLEASIMCVMVAKELGVKRVVAKAASERMGDVLRRVGADEIVYPEQESAVQTARKMLSDTFLDFLQLGDDVCVIRMSPRREWIGKTLRELRLRNEYRINVVALQEKDASFNVFIDPDRRLTASMQLLVLGNTGDLGRLRD